MASLRPERVRPAPGLALASVITEALDCPSLLIGDTGQILSANAPWRLLFADLGGGTQLPSIQEWLARFQDSDAILMALNADTSVREPVIARLKSGGPERPRSFELRVVHASIGLANSPVTAIIMTEVLTQSTARDDHPDPSARMNRLLVRQTLIEERERRRLGRAVHDQVTQLLAQVRRQIADARDGHVAWQPTETIADIDRVIRVLQDLTSTFSPPVLEDLGLIPAMHWLAEHISASYGAPATCEDDGTEPAISPEVRTIAFRALRELAVNAAKHAPGSNIVLSSCFEHGCCRLSVADNGPGFDREALRSTPESHAGYGLLSVEQQIRAVGGMFELRSRMGDGTCAVITLPPTSSEKSDDDATSA